MESGIRNEPPLKGRMRTRLCRAGVLPLYPTRLRPEGVLHGLLFPSRHTPRERAQFEMMWYKFAQIPSTHAPSRVRCTHARTHTHTHAHTHTHTHTHTRVDAISLAHGVTLYSWLVLTAVMVKIHTVTPP